MVGRYLGSAEGTRESERKSRSPSRCSAGKGQEDAENKVSTAEVEDSGTTSPRCNVGVAVELEQR